MSATTKGRTAAELRQRFPRGFGAEGISVLTVGDYRLALREVPSYLGWTVADAVRFVELAIDRHAGAVQRQQKTNLRLYGTTSNVGRNRYLQNRITRGNEQVLRQLRALRDELVVIGDSATLQAALTATRSDGVA